MVRGTRSRYRARWHGPVAAAPDCDPAGLPVPRWRWPSCRRVSLTLGPVLSAQRLTGPLPPVTPRATLAHRGAGDHPRPGAGAGAELPCGLVDPAPAAPPDGPSATATMRVALNDRLDRIRAKYAMPGRLRHGHLPGRHDLDRGERPWPTSRGKVPVTADTAFALASVTKTFTAALILSMVEEGEVDLDASVLTVPARACASTRR